MNKVKQFLRKWLSIEEDIKILTESIAELENQQQALEEALMHEEFPLCEMYQEILDGKHQEVASATCEHRRVYTNEKMKSLSTNYQQ